ncbi:hypothetical protein RHGRI_033489 [Rhododendron griersonianum]|uniref:Uncharacterized protein n=1 Tax=Rhododendron griersonianum TaxID=479676 RepID=A0AAV6HWZ2_9ERIC|nr:hypothetical protein RHGRI_033489 [Rhododendron griersonianum]
MASVAKKLDEVHEINIANAVRWGTDEELIRRNREMGGKLTREEFIRQPRRRRRRRSGRGVGQRWRRRSRGGGGVRVSRKSNRFAWVQNSRGSEMMRPSENWERLVRATLRREKLRHDSRGGHMRAPSGIAHPGDQHRSDLAGRRRDSVRGPQCRPNP